ncbi:MAG: recombinase family protein [Rhodobacteraceae bacterium]|nr:recombinase family protein [Paracoccaceae bacterium]
MWTTEASAFKVATQHQAKWAYVYVRQSSPGQVVNNRESTDLQYRLVERAVEMGWPRARVKVIDDDLGKSGRSASERYGFQHLLAEIGLGEVGLVLSFDASRLARNNRDWYQLLELCSVFGTLIADSERVYDPGLYTDRLLLGLSGMMSEAELHQLKRRLHAGALNKAQRGELRQRLPVGLFRQQTGDVILHPDEEVQARLQLVFEKFQELKTGRAVLRYLHRENLWLPSRPLQGPAPHEVVWQRARNSMILAILKNPAYAGTYVYGRYTLDPTKRKPGHPYSGRVRRALDDWPIVVHNIYPAYITWETFLANQAQLKANQNRYQEDQSGVPRKGQALLQGIVRCGRCGRKMRMRYSGPEGNYPVYECVYAVSEYSGPRCQEVRGLGLDAQVEKLLLEALEPDKLELALAALGELEQEYAALRRQRELHLERLRYEVQRAQRQYHAVEPENRLVARSLEKLWEEKLRALEKGEKEFEAWASANRLELQPADREAILALGSNLSAIWHAPGTTAADRKQILRLVIKEVIVDQKRAHGMVWFQINWQTSATSQHQYARRVNAYKQHAYLDRIQQRIWELHAAGKLDDEIAEALNAEGLLTTKQGPFDKKTIWWLRNHLGVPAVKPNGPHPDQWQNGTYSAQGAAEAIGVFVGTIYKWIKTGRLEAYQPRKGTPYQIHLTPKKIVELQKYVQRVRRSKKEAS